jgi:hypothetical protein
MSSTCALSCTFLESVTYRSTHEDDPPSSEGSNGESDYGNSTLAELVTLCFTCFLLRPSVPPRSIELQKSGGIFNFYTFVDPIFKGKHGPRDCDWKIVGHFLVSRLRK